MANKTLPAEQNAPAVVKYGSPGEWATILAFDINNHFEMGLSERALLNLGRMIYRRAQQAGDCK